MVRPRLNSQPHILKDPFGFARRLRQIPITQGLWMITADVGEVFLSDGQHALQPDAMKVG